MLFLVAIGVAIALVVLQRSGGSDDATLPVAPAAPRPAQTEEERVVAAYNNYTKAGDEAMGVPDADSPLLPVYATNPHLDALRASIRNLQENGMAMRAPPDSTRDDRVTVVSMDGDRARISVCSIEDGYLARASDGQPMGVAASGEVVPTDPGGRKLTSLMGVDMVREFGTWKVSSLKQEQQWEGVAGCAVGQ